MSPLVSAVVPTYDRPEAVRRALRSVNAQTYEPIEVIVVETPSADGSTTTTDLTDVVAHPLTHVQTDLDVGPSAARNIGMEVASGAYIAFLDDDDEWFPEKTATQVDRLESVPAEVAASVTGNLKVGPGGSPRGTYLPGDPDDLVAHQLSWNIGTFSMLMVRSDVPEIVGPIDERLDRREDQDFLLRIAQEFDFDVVREPLVRKHAGEQDQLSNDYEAAAAANAHFREKHGDLADELGVREDMEASLQFMLGRTAMLNADYASARRHFAAAIRRKPRSRNYYLNLLAVLGGPVTHRVARELGRRGLV